MNIVPCIIDNGSCAPAVMGPLGLVVEHLAIVDMVAMVVVAVWIINNNNNNNNVINRDRANAIQAETTPAARLEQDNADRVAAPTQVVDWRFQTLNSKYHMLIQVRQRRRNQDRRIVSDASAMDILLMCVRQTLIVLYATKIIHIFRKKPDASLFSFGEKRVRIFQIPDFDFNVETADPSPTGMVDVTGGKLPAEIVQAELGKLTWI